MSEEELRELNRESEQITAAFKALQARATAAEAKVAVLESLMGIPRAALKGSTEADLVCGTLGDSDGDDGA